MNDDTGNLILAKIDALSERLETVEDRLSAIEQHMLVMVAAMRDIMAKFDLDRRLRKVEDGLGLKDDAKP